MNKFDEYLHKNASEEPIQVPDSVRNHIDQILAELPEIETETAAKKTTSQRVIAFPRIAATAACVAFIILFALPNISVTYANAIEKVPVLGDFVKVITIRNYLYEDDRHKMDIDVPEIETETSTPSTEFINEDVSEMTNKLVEHFYDELEASGGNSYGSVSVDYEVLTNTERWFTLKLSVLETAASSNNYFVYYHIDKLTGKMINLGDLFAEEDYNDVLTKEIKKQMQKQMQEDENLVYWIHDSEIGEDFASISPKHNFYFNTKGNLVIPFDQYEVAPGYMGCPEFVIPTDITKKLFKNEYKDMLP